MKSNVNTPDFPALHLITTSNTIVINGNLTWSQINEKQFNQKSNLIIEDIIKNFKDKKELQIDAQGIIELDTVGAYFLIQFIDKLKSHYINITNFKLSNLNQELLNNIVNYSEKVEPYSKSNSTFSILDVIKNFGELSINLINTILSLIAFFGNVCVNFVKSIVQITTFEWNEVIRTLYNAGLNGLMVSMLLSFLIGVTLTYEMSPQFSSYGANLYIVNFLGISLLKEVTPLLVAVIVAGRTGSSITAEIGTQKLQEEIDALKVMGISPIQRLVLPKIIGVIIALPLLTAISDLISLIGGAIIANLSLDIPYSLFIERFQNYVSINNYTCGIIKSVVFGLVISLVGCFCGFNVQNNANSIGRETTRSVVISIVLIVFFDAVFAIIFKVLDM